MLQTPRVGAPPHTQTRTQHPGVRAGERGRARIAAAAWLALAATAVGAQPYPSKPVRFIVPFPPGGSTDLIARTFGAKFTEAWGQLVVIENRGGANTIIGAEAAAKSPPDGYTMFLTTAATMTTNAIVYRKLPYDPKTSFALVSMLTVSPYVIAAHPSLPATDIKALVALARQRPAQLAYGTSGNGSSGHLAGALLEIMAGIKLLHVPYKGAAAALTDALGGQNPLVITGATGLAPLARAERIRVLAACSSERIASWPDLPTMAESGYPGFVGITWFGLVVPAGTPKPVIDRLQAETVRVGAMQDVRERLATQGFEVTAGTPEAFATFVAREYERVARVVKLSGIKVE